MRRISVVPLLSLCALAYYIALIAYGSSLVGFSLFWALLGVCGFGGSALAEWRRQQGKPPLVGKKLRRALAVLCAAGALVAAGCLAFILTPRTTGGAEPCAYLIVLGSGIRRDGNVSATLAERLNTAAGYLRAHPEARAIVSGGKGCFEPFAESQAMAAYLTARGTDANRIAEESRSRDTIENMRFSRRIIREQTGGDVPVAVLTSDFHLARALLLARRIGFADAVGVAAPTPPLVRVDAYTREILAVLKLCARIILLGVR
jgi:uncharacterized SAM-binding protein YcdF (DUF218 family)